MSVQQERYYTYTELRRMAKERRLKLGTNVPRSDLCRLLNISLGDRGVCFRGKMERKPVRLVNIHSGDSMTFPSANRTSRVLGVGGGDLIKRRICGQKVVIIPEDINYHHGSTYTIAHVVHTPYTM